MLSFSCENQFEQKKSKPGYGTISFNLNCERTVQENLSDAIFEQFKNIALYSKTADSLQKWEEISAPIKNWSNYEAFLDDANVSIKIGTYDFLLVAFIGDGKNNDTKFVSEIKNVQINVTDNDPISFSMKITDCGTEKGSVEVSFSLGESDIGERIEFVNFIKYTLKKVTYTAEGRQTEDYDEITIPNEEIEEITEDSLIFSAELPAGIYDLTARFETDVGGSYGYGEVAEYSTTISVSENLESKTQDPIEIDKFNPFSAIAYETPDFIDITEYGRPQKISVYDEILPADLPVLQKDGYDFIGWYTSPNPVEDTKFTGIPKYSFYDEIYVLYACFVELGQQDQQQYLLFSKREDVTGYNLCMTADLTTEPTLQPIHIGPLQGFTVGGNENFYYMITAENGGDIFNSSDTSWLGDLYSNDGNLVSLYYDYESKIMYGMPESFNYLNFYRKEGDADSEYLSFYQIVADSNDTPIRGCSKYDFAVNNEALYIAYKNVFIYVDKFDINKEASPLTCTHYITNEISFYNNEYLNSILASEYFTITDMICLNENLYIAWKYSPTQGYQTDAGSIEFASFGGIFCMNEDLSSHYLYNIGFIPTETEERSYTVSNASTGELEPFNYLGADSIDDKNSFFGPTKFIAYESNKLIFADEGVFVSQEDGDSSASFENVNRIVEIDLSNINSDGTFIDVYANVIKTVSNNVTFETEFQELQISENCIINK